MRRLFLPALIAAALLAAPLQALDLENITGTERQMLREEIRAYLLENPEVIMEAVAILEQRDARAKATQDARLVAANADAIFRDDHSWVGGNPDGDVTLVEFMDYRCGYCRRAAPEVNALIKSDGNIRFVVKEFPILGQQSLLSSRFAIATRLVAGDEAYKAVHDALLSLKGEVNDTTLGRLGKTLGLDTATIMARMDSPEVNRVIADNRQLARKLGLSGTPSFVLDEQILRGYLPRAAMEQRVAAVRAED